MQKKMSFRVCLAPNWAQLLPVLIAVWATLTCLHAGAAEKKSVKHKAIPQESIPSRPAPVSTPPAELTPMPDKLNVIATAFGQTGVRRCLGRIQQVTDFLTVGGKAGAFTFTPLTQQDNSLLSASMEVATPGALSYASASFHPRKNECGAVYEAVTYWQSGCGEVASGPYSQLRQVGALQSQIRVLEGGPAMRVFLMPAGTGCVAIKKEVMY